MTTPPTLEQAVDLIEDLIQSVQTLQGMCGEPPEDSDQASWAECEVVANAAQNFVDSLRPTPTSHPCDGCGVSVREDEYLGYDKANGETEYFCENCFHLKYNAIPTDNTMECPTYRPEGGE